MSNQPYSVLYSGFVFVDTTSVPARPEAKTVFEMFKKRNLKKTRAAHSLWARGLPQRLSLSVTEAGICVSDKGAVVFESPIHKVFFATCIQSTMVVFIRRSGYEASFKGHVFVFGSDKDAEVASEVLIRLTSMLGFRRQSMSMVPRASSISSIDMLLPGFVPIESPMTSRPTSRVNSDDESEASDSDVKEREPSPVITATESPCGVCKQASGDNWIALKTCGHQHHLSCIAAWRVDHNVCPCCPAPVSNTSFSLRYLGGCFSEGRVTLSEVAALGEDYKSMAASADTLRVHVTTHQINFLNKLGSLTTEVRSCNLLADLDQVLLIETLLVLVFVDGSGYLVQIFEVPFGAEASIVHAALKNSCSL